MPRSQSSNNNNNNNNSSSQDTKDLLLREKILTHDCLRSSLNPQTLAKLPKEVQTELFKLLPSVDQNLLASTSSNCSPLNNSYFNSACRLYMERLANNEIKIEQGVVTRAGERRMLRERSSTRCKDKKKPKDSNNLNNNNNNETVTNIDKPAHSVEKW